MRSRDVKPGARFGFWTVEITGLDTTPVPSRNGRGYAAAWCRCDCNNQALVRLDVLMKGASRSCGCKMGELKGSIYVPVVGDVFSRLTVIETGLRATTKHRDRVSRCRCECGTEVVVYDYHLFSGNTQSCGCYNRERTSETLRGEFNTTVGLTRHYLYDTWKSMMRRCHTETDKDYGNYGGRGIQVCGEWHDPSKFLSWIDANLGGRPPFHSLDRIDNNGNYEPGNVRWADFKTQINNRGPRTSWRSPENMLESK